MRPNRNQFPASIPASQFRDRMSGAEISLGHVPVPELIAVTDPDLRHQFASLKNEHQREAFLDALLQRLDASVFSWATFYEAVAILRDHRPYWHKLGFASFADFWQIRAAPAFQAWKDLEDMYAFAKLACPSLFDLDQPRARRLTARLNALSAPTQKQRRQVKGTKRLFETSTSAVEAVRHALKWRMVSNRSFEYRLYRLKRDHPDIAAALLAGDYTLRLDSGMYTVDLIKAERQAYGDTYGLRGPPPKSLEQPKSRSQAAEERQVLREITHLAKAAARSKDLQKRIAGRLLKLPWLVQAISNSGQNGPRHRR